jgi:ribosomal protein S18 acetylase RimI-like enzyme
MTGVAIRQLTTADLTSAFALSSTAGWNQRMEDWRMLLTLAPDGSFTATVDGRIVGTAIGINYGTFGWIAMMLVDPAHRGQGLGARLLQAAMDAVPSDLPIRLDATPLGRPLYERFGFVEGMSLTRLVAQSAERFPEVPERTARTSIADLDEIAYIDAAAFGADRRRVFEWSLSDAPYARMARQKDRLLGYCFGRRGRLFDQIGPVVARDEEVARALVSSAITDVPARPAVIDVYDSHRGIVAWLRSIGFHAERPLFRMSRGPMTRARSDHHEFAIFGPEFG